MIKLFSEHVSRVCVSVCVWKLMQFDFLFVTFHKNVDTVTFGNILQDSFTYDISTCVNSSSSMIYAHIKLGHQSFYVNMESANKYSDFITTTDGRLWHYNAKYLIMGKIMHATTNTHTNYQHAMLKFFFFFNWIFVLYCHHVMSHYIDNDTQR